MLLPLKLLVFLELQYLFFEVSLVMCYEACGRLGGSFLLWSMGTFRRQLKAENIFRRKIVQSANLKSRFRFLFFFSFLFLKFQKLSYLIAHESPPSSRRCRCAAPRCTATVSPPPSLLVCATLLLPTLRPCCSILKHKLCSILILKSCTRFSGTWGLGP